MLPSCNMVFQTENCFVPISWVSHFSVDDLKLPIPLSQHTQITVDNKVYVLGGMKSNEDGTTEANKDIYQ